MAVTKKNDQWVMTERDVALQAKSILDGQPSETVWNKEQHVALIAQIAEEHGLPATMRNKFEKALEIQGVGGNASQFRQWLQKKGMPVSTQAEKTKKMFAGF